MADHSEDLPRQSHDEIDAYFASYPRFAYRRDQPIHSELSRMYDTFGWGRENPKRKKSWARFRIAVIRAFNSAFGSDAENITSWQRICHCLGVAPSPRTLGDARKAVVETYVNLVDLLQSVRNGTPVETFSTLEALRAYTVANRLYFPKDEAYEGALLRFLLREIHHEYKGRRGRRPKNKRKGREPGKAGQYHEPGAPRMNQAGRD
ncbi:uncharacterized protein APUU_60050S [Aspergillus puulaauensis]|uniref:Uncharacterized protein n=1 Tax=Aspergillus puulaauensis TaxID=1220207 RepID=A0A7R7XTC2_9EURO|nr:uncharacterized protein APUU_60050S [Aspergillus puulaauensis]BCS27002.1 hypothetical protein APUU_60050S [Aspergillus puulaauensis]